jgi:tetratricopeptide (TPR) repeat protein
MLKRLANILVSSVALAVLGCPNVIPERSAREWMADGRIHSAEARWDDAIADFTEVLRLEPKSREALVQRAHASYQNGDADQALDDCDAALRLEPNDVELRRFRADVYRKTGDVAKADLDDHEANQAQNVFQRGRQAQFQRDYRAAAADYEDAVRLDPRNVEYRNQLAWVQATCPDDAVRNGRHAVELALEVCELTKWRDPKVINTLAAAYAEAGQFEEAVKMQQKAMELVGPRRREDFRRRLKMYEEQKPYRFVGRR